MLMDERQIALNDVIVACREAADHYGEVADGLEGGALAELFREYGRRHEDFASQLEEHIRRLGVLPRDLNADRELIERLITGIKATLSGDRRRMLIENREQAEAQIAALISAALKQNLPDETKSLLDRIQDEVEDIRSRLAEEKAQSE